jgi:hypothetical protein
MGFRPMRFFGLAWHSNRRRRQLQHDCCPWSNWHRCLFLWQRWHAGRETRFALGLGEVDELGELVELVELVELGELRRHPSD